MGIYLVYIYIHISPFKGFQHGGWLKQPGSRVPFPRVEAPSHVDDLDLQDLLDAPSNCLLDARQRLGKVVGVGDSLLDFDVGVSVFLFFFGGWRGWFG